MQRNLVPAYFLVRRKLSNKNLAQFEIPMRDAKSSHK